MKHLTITFLLFCNSFLFAQKAFEDSSFIDKIDLTLGVEGGIIKTKHFVRQLDQFTYRGTPIDQTISFDMAPIFSIRAGLRGFGFDFYAFLQNSFLNYGAEGRVQTVKGYKTIQPTQELYERGLGLLYQIPGNWQVGFVYSKYSGSIGGQDGTMDDFRSLYVSFYFQQLKAKIKYNLHLKNNMVIPFTAAFTLYSYMPNVNERIMIEFHDQVEGSVPQYRYNFDGKPFNISFEAGFFFDFPLIPIFRYEYLYIDSSYHIHMMSLLMRWIIPNEF